MKMIDDVIIIGIDSGYGNMKTANCCFPASVSAYDKEPVFKENLLVFERKFYLIGEGHKEFLADKTRDLDYYVLALAAIARELNIRKMTCGKIKIAAGLPLTWVSGQRDEFRDYLMQNKAVDFSFRNVSYHVEIVGVDVFPQGFAAVADRLSDFRGVNMICDIGNGTMNIMFINDKKPVSGNMFTEKYGTHQCLLAVRENVMCAHHTTVDEAIINRVFRFGTADIKEDYLKTITDTATDYVEGIFQRLREHEYNPELMRLYVLGGGSCLIRNFGVYDASRVTINDDICATAKGYEYLDQWLEVVRARIKPATFGSYQGVVKSTIGPYFRKKELTLKELEARHIQQFYTEKLKTVTPNSVIHYHAVIYQALKYAMKTDMVPQNVAMKVDRPRKNSFQPTFLDAEQMQKLFEIVKGTRLELPVLVAAFYGLRRGEVLGLKWDAIDFNRGTLTIKRTVTEATIDGTMKIIEQDSAKTKSSLRTLPLVGSFRDYFQKVKEAQELNKKVCGNCYNYNYDGYVFVNELGERMRPNYLTEYFPKYIAKHGMPKMRFHDLCHPYVKHTTKIFSLRLMDFQAQAYPDARRKTRGACQLLRVGQSRSPVRPLCNRKRFSCLPPQSKMSWILYAISMRLSGYTSTRSISSSASSVVSVSASKIALDASLRLSCRACSSCFFFACANTAA